MIGPLQAFPLREAVRMVRGSWGFLKRLPVSGR
jgi:hypothetical protein